MTTTNKNTSATPFTFDSLDLPCGKKVSVGDFIHTIFETVLGGNHKQVTGFVTCIVEEDGYCDCDGDPLVTDVKIMSLDGATTAIVGDHIVAVDSAGDAPAAVKSIAESVIAAERARADARAALESAECALKDANKELRSLSDRMRLASGQLDDGMIIRIAEDELADTDVTACYREALEYAIDSIGWRKPSAHAMFYDGKLRIVIEIASKRHDVRRASFCDLDYGEPCISDEQEALNTAKKLYHLAFYDNVRGKWTNGIPYERVTTNVCIRDKGVIACTYSITADVTDRTVDGIRKLVRNMISGVMSNVVDATLISVWDGEYEIGCKCLVDTDKMEIVSLGRYLYGNPDSASVKELDEQFVVMGDGRRFTVANPGDCGVTDKYGNGVVTIRL